MPDLHLLVGSNGSGKSTYVERVLAPHYRDFPFVNADVIAAQDWPGEEEGHGYEAASRAAEQRERLIAAGTSFIAETVFSHPSKIDLIRTALHAGYLVHLNVLLVPVDVTADRVAERVRRGGHTVPEAKVRARYERLWAHVAEAIALADAVEVLDNSIAEHPFTVVAVFAQGLPTATATWPTWTPPELMALA